ncbi:MAG: DUF5911 domain-containing protein [Nitrospiraceae bacterium]|nr:DUF5911 domain-containing protein [Nitrospiraceae bacterium]
MAYTRLEDYGVIGDLETCALITRDGSIDWLCLPHIGSRSVFAALLDPERGGHCRIRPQTKYHSSQSYAGDTNILRTSFTTPLGDVLNVSPDDGRYKLSPRASFRQVRFNAIISPSTM